MMRKMEEDEGDVEVSLKNELICLTLRKIELMNLMTSFLQMPKMAVNDGVKATG